MGLLFAYLFGSGNEVAAVGVEADGTLVSEHVSEGHELLWIRKNLMHEILISEFVVEVELGPGKAVSEPIVLNAFPSHGGLPSFELRTLGCRNPRSK